MLTPSDFKQQLRDALHGHLALPHPMMADLSGASGPNWPLLRRAALQGYQLTRHFIGYVEHLFFHCPLPNHRGALLANVYEEETGRLSGSDNHLLLMQRFLRALGISDVQRESERPLPATAELIRYRLQAVRDPMRYHVAAASVLIASEGQNLSTASGESRHALLRRVYGLSEADVLFFSVHEVEDVGHVEQGLGLVSALCTHEHLQTEALQAVNHTCRLFQRMHDEVLQDHLRRAADVVGEVA